MLSGKNKKESPKLYWSLVLEPEWVQAGIWQIKDDEAILVSDSPPSAWELDDELIETTDSVLSSAVQELSEEFDEEPEDAVFGILSSWVKGGEIKGSYLEVIKKICDQLDLKPAGFVVLPEAVAHYYKSQESAPLSAVVIGVFKEDLELSLFKSGELSNSTQVARSVSYVDDVVEGLSRLKVEEVPSRMILYNAKESDLEDVRQKLIKANWDDLKGIRYLHTPKIEIISPQDKLKAVSLAGASELGNVESISEADEEAGASEKVTTKSEVVDNIKEPEEKLTAKELGFVVGKDVAEMQEDKREETKVKQKLQTDHSSVETNRVPEEKPRKKSVSKKNPLRKLLTTFGGLSLPKPKKPTFPSISASPLSKTFVIGVLVLVGLFLSGFLAWWFLPKATVTVYLTTKPLDERVTVIAMEEPSESESENVVSASTVAKEVSGNDTRSTTGTKLVGEQAAGEVTIFRVGPEITLSSGTELEGPGGLRFTLDEDVNVASGSPNNAGTTNTSITASDIGAQYNLVSGSQFTIANYSIYDLEAENNSAFTGGSSREINAVSEKDRDELRGQLTDELVERLKEEIQGEISDNQILVEESIETEVVESDFSSDVGEEAISLSLDMTVEANALILNKDEVIEIAMRELKDREPEGFILRESQIETEFDIRDSENGEYEIVVKVRANLLPETQPDEIAEKIKGRYPEVAKKYLQSEVPGFVRADVIMDPSLPGRLRTLPHVSDNIEVLISSDR